MAELGTSTVSAPSRIHLGLHDCGYATSRIFGGVGIIIDGFPTVVTSRISTEPSLEFHKSLSPSIRASNEAASLVDRIHSQLGNVAVGINALAPEHRGFGSKTSLLLAIAQSAFLAYGNNFGEHRDDIIRLTKRGGTSGIGVNGFWTGGLIVDGGHCPEKPTRQFLPSSTRSTSKIPPLLANHHMPENWRVQLFYDDSAELIEGEKEIELFQRLMPLPDHEIYKAMVATFHGIIPATIEGDIESFSSAVQKINNSGMKKEEVALQSPNTVEFLNHAWDNNLAAGLTSFGPTVFCITDDSTKQSDLVNDIAKNHRLTSLGKHAFNNQGAHQLC